MDPKVAVLLLAVAGRLAAVSVRAGASPNAVSTKSSSASKPVTPSAPLKELQDDDVDGGGGEADDADDGRGREPAGAAPGGEYSVEYVSDKKQGVVVGSYSLVGPDGSQRTLQYSADPVHGFTAVVRRDAGVGAALFVKAPPVSAPPPAPAPWAGPAVVLVRPQEQQQLVLGPTPLPPLPPLPPPPPPQLLVTPAPSTRIVSIGVHRPQAEVVNIGGDTRKAAVPGRVHLNGPHFLLSAQPLPLFTYAAAPAGVPAYAPGGAFAAPPGAAPALGPPPPFLFLGQQQASSGTSDPQPHRAVFSLLQYAPPSLPPPPPQPAARSRFPHPDPPVHFATAPGYTSAVFTAFSNPFVSYAYR